MNAPMTAPTATDSGLTGSLDVLIIGAGFAGVGAAIRLRQQGICLLYTSDAADERSV